MTNLPKKLVLFFVAQWLFQIFLHSNSSLTMRLKVRKMQVDVGNEPYLSLQYFIR